MPKGILTVSQSAVNVIEICTIRSANESLGIDDLLENSTILLRYIITKKRARRIRKRPKHK